MPVATAIESAYTRPVDAPTGVPANPTVDDLVREHLPLVGHLVRELLSRLPAHVSRDELTSAGQLALVTCAQGFDAARGVPFGRFAAIRIRGALTDELRSMDWASRAVRTKAREVEAARNELAAALGRTPRRDEVARAMGFTAAELDAVDADVQRASVLSLHGLTDEDGGVLPTTDSEPESLLLHREELGLLRDAIAELPDRLRSVVEQYFFQQRRMVEIAADLGVTESRISQLRSEALAMLRAGLHAQDAVQDGSHDRDGRADPLEPATGTEHPQSRRGSARRAYCAAIAARSSLATRLAASTLLGEPRYPAAAPLAQVAGRR